jgi:hypothetical protein
VGIKLAYYNSEDVPRLRELLANISPWHDPRSVHMALMVQQIALGQALISVPAMKHPAKIGSQLSLQTAGLTFRDFKGNSVH